MAKFAVAPIDYPPDILADLVAAEPNASNFGVALKRLRETSGMSQDALGRSVGCSGTTIGHYELGDSFPYDARNPPIVAWQSRGPTVSAQMIAKTLGLPEPIAAQFLELHRCTTAFAHENGKVERLPPPEAPDPDRATTFGALLNAYYIKNGRPMLEIRAALHYATSVIDHWLKEETHPFNGSDEHLNKIADAFGIEDRLHRARLMVFYHREKIAERERLTGTSADPYAAETLSAFLQAYSLRNERSLREIGKTLGCSEAVVSDWHRGHKLPKPERLKDIAEAYGIPPHHQPKLANLYHEATLEKRKRHVDASEHPDQTETFSDCLRAHFLLSTRTAKTIADQLGCGDQSVRNWNDGTTLPPYAQLADIADAYLITNHKDRLHLEKLYFQEVARRESLGMQIPPSHRPGERSVFALPNGYTAEVLAALDTAEAEGKFGDAVRLHRTAAGMRQQDLAEALHCGRSTIVAYESGDSIPPDASDWLPKVNGASTPTVQTFANRLFIPKPLREQFFATHAKVHSLAQELPDPRAATTYGEFLEAYAICNHKHPQALARALHYDAAHIGQWQKKAVPPEEMQPRIARAYSIPADDRLLMTMLYLEAKEPHRALDARQH